jgi:LacI family transcriptional regulator
MAHVQHVIESLGYVPNQAARALKGHRTKMIGLIIPSLVDPFFSSCAEAAQAVARANDSLLIVTVATNDPRNEIENLNVLIRQRVDGLIIVPSDSNSKALRDLLNKVAIPIVTIDRPMSNSSIASVVAENFKGAALATQHLIEHGYKRIVCLTGESSLYTIRERMAGYRKAVEAAHLSPIFDTSVKDYRSAERAIWTLLDSPNPADAIFALKNSTTIFAFEALQKFNIAVPETIALLGFDDFELASTVRPSISVIEQPVKEIGRRAAEILFEDLFDKSKTKVHPSSQHARQIKMMTRLIKRRSCGCTPPNV